MRSSAREPSKSEPPLAEKSPLHPTRSVAEEAAGSVMVAACAKTSAPSRKAEESPEKVKAPARDCVKGIGSAATLLGSAKDATTTEPEAS